METVGISTDKQLGVSRETWRGSGEDRDRASETVRGRGSKWARKSWKPQGNSLESQRKSQT